MLWSNAVAPPRLSHSLRDRQFASSAIDTSCGPDMNVFIRWTAAIVDRRPGSTMNCELTAAWIGRPRIDIRRGMTPRNPAIDPSASLYTSGDTSSSYGLSRKIPRF